MQAEQPRRQGNLLGVSTLLLVWCLAAWAIATRSYVAETSEVVRQQTQLAHLRAEDLADSIQRNLAYLSGVPAFFTHGLRVVHTLSRYGPRAAPSTLPHDERKARWTADPALHDLDETLAMAADRLHVDLIFVINAAGDTVAASNWEDIGSAVGTNYAERRFFQENRAGRAWMQFAVGKSTHVPGLYFASPVILDGKFLGTVMAKADVGNLTFLIKETSAYVTDTNGVIVLSDDKRREMLAIPGAAIHAMPAAERQETYERTGFAELDVQPWGDLQFPALVRIQGKDIPSLVASRALPEFGLTVYVEDELPAYFTLQRERNAKFLAAAAIGVLVILLAYGTLLHIRSIRLSRDRLRESEERYSLRLANLGDGVYETDRDGRCTYNNPTALAMLGLAEDEVLGQDAHDLFHHHLPDGSGYELARCPIHHTLRDGQRRQIEDWFWRKDGSGFPVALTASPIWKFGQRLGVIVVFQDITERRHLDESRRLSSLIYQTSHEAMVVTDANNLIVDVNPAFTQQTGYTLAEVAGMNPKIFQSGHHDAAFYQEMWRSLIEKGHWQGELWDRRKDGSLQIKLANISVIRNADGSIFRHVAQFFDITDRKRQEEMIRTQAYFDTLTELPNRRLFVDRLEQETKKARRTGKPLALLFIDLDRFKEVNDTLGHAKGDALLVEAARRLVRCVRETDTVARMGGDEFTLILPEFGERVHLERVAQDILQALSRPYTLEGSEVGYISGSMGIAVYPEDATVLDDLMKHADRALYASKTEGRGRFSYFSPSMQKEAREKLELTSALRFALARNEMEVYYQPIVELATGRIAKAEALLRWTHPERGPISPEVFIPLAEEFGLIHEIGDWVFRQASAAAAAWRSELGCTVQVSINRSPIEFDRGAAHWISTLEAVGLPGDSIAIEITEGLLLKQSDKVKQALADCRRHGIAVSIDDFGTGFSALSYLKRFEIDYLKVDRSFVRHLADSESDKALVEAIVVMAHKLSIRAIAEGVETEAQRDLLQAFGCDYAQGHFYARPLPAQAFKELLANHLAPARP